MQRCCLQMGANAAMAHPGLYTAAAELHGRSPAVRYGQAAALQARAFTGGACSASHPDPLRICCSSAEASAGVPYAGAALHSASTCGPRQGTTNATITGCPSTSQEE